MLFHSWIVNFLTWQSKSTDNFNFHFYTQRAEMYISFPWYHFFSLKYWMYQRCVLFMLSFDLRDTCGESNEPTKIWCRTKGVTFMSKQNRQIQLFTAWTANLNESKLDIHSGRWTVWAAFWFLTVDEYTADTDENMAFMNRGLKKP